MAGLAPAAAGWVAARLAVAAGFLAAHLLSGTVDLPDGRLHLDEGLGTWDGTFYRVIAEGWYGGQGTPAEAARFFPAFPALGRVLAPLVGGSHTAALVVLANVAALAAAVLLWHLAREVTGDLGVADRSAWMVAVVPAADVFAFAYSESLMLLVVVAALLALHRRSPWPLVALGLAAGMLRPTGVLLAVAVATGAVLAARDHPDERRPGRVAAWVAATAAPVVGLGVAMWVVSRRSGDLGEALDIQRRLRNGFRDPLTRLGEAVLDIATGHLHDVYNLAFAVGFAALFVVAWRRRQPTTWLVLMGLTWLVAASADRIDSFGRYCVVAAPFTVALAQVTPRRPQQAVVGAVGLLATAWYTAEVLLGRVIP